MPCSVGTSIFTSPVTSAASSDANGSLSSVAGWGALAAGALRRALRARGASGAACPAAASRAASSGVSVRIEPAEIQISSPG